jgi:hypothetical protein
MIIDRIDCNGHRLNRPNQSSIESISTAIDCIDDRTNHHRTGHQSQLSSIASAGMGRNDLRSHRSSIALTAIRYSRRCSLTYHCC